MNTLEAHQENLDFRRMNRETLAVSATTIGVGAQKHFRIEIDY